MVANWTFLRSGDLIKLDCYDLRACLAVLNRSYIALSWASIIYVDSGRDVFCKKHLLNK